MGGRPTAYAIVFDEEKLGGDTGSATHFALVGIGAAVTATDLPQLVSTLGTRTFRLTVHVNADLRRSTAGKRGADTFSYKNFLKNQL